MRALHALETVQVPWSAPKPKWKRGEQRRLDKLGISIGHGSPGKEMKLFRRSNWAVHTDSWKTGIVSKIGFGGSHGRATRDTSRSDLQKHFLWTVWARFAIKFRGASHKEEDQRLVTTWREPFVATAAVRDEGPMKNERVHRELVVSPPSSDHASRHFLEMMVAKAAMWGWKVPRHQPAKFKILPWSGQKMLSEKTAESFSYPSIAFVTIELQTCAGVHVTPPGVQPGTHTGKNAR